jgi:hypothetical protein
MHLPQKYYSHISYRHTSHTGVRLSQAYISYKCCAQQTSMQIMVVEALLIAIYLEEKDAYMHIRLP